MGIIQAYKMAIKAIVGNKVRSFLTMLGVIIGVSAVIASVAFAQGSTANITNTLKGLGTNLVQVTITGRNSNRNVTYDEMQDFSNQNQDIVQALSPVVSGGNVTLKVGNKSTTTTSLTGTNPDYEVIKDMHVQNGRFLLQQDIDYYQKVALIGTAVVNSLYGGADPVGRIIKINGQEFKVVGELEQVDTGLASSNDDVIIIPASTAERLTKSTVIRNYSIQATTADNTNTVVDKLNTFLAGIYGGNTQNPPYRVVNQIQMLSTLNSITGVMTVILAGIAAISLVVGGIGIMNIMLVSVSERTKEIGIRKAIGAKRRNILIQFLIEALMVTGIGGIIGVLLGLSIIKFVIGGAKLVPVVYSVPWTVLSFGISLIVGVVFGLFPAFKASKMNPIEALRFE
ncbi:MAG: ABC transporter permease [Bacillota bacterium]|nr:ABC transporter permease [Bacillota bacterium]